MREHITDIDTTTLKKKIRDNVSTFQPYTYKTPLTVGFFSTTSTRHLWENNCHRNLFSDHWGEKVPTIEGGSIKIKTLFFLD